MALVAAVAPACGSESGSAGGGGETRTVLADYQHDEFASAFLRYYPEQVKVRPGDTVRFKQTWTGEPHSVTMGRAVDDMVKNLPLIQKYESVEEALAAGETQETIDNLLASFGKVPGMVGQGDFEVFQAGAQPCYIADMEDVPEFSIDDVPNPDAECPPGGKRKPAFNGRQALYNSGFIPYEGEKGNVFDVPVAKDAEPGTYTYFCNYHWLGMSGTIEIVKPTASIPSQSEVTRQARQEIEADAKVALKKVRDAERAAAKGKVGDLNPPLSGLTSDDEFAVIINEFVPRKARAKVGQKVTWTFDGFVHTVSFNVPKYFPLFTTAKDGTVTWNPRAHEPVGFEVPDDLPAFDRQEGAPEPRALDAGEWDGRGGFFSSGALGPPDTFSLTFTRPGTYRYACVLHPQMIGTVDVRP
ncbi:MAG TPA: hypothetical protein VF230_05780 [Acidimicrobiales bacterium]